MGGVENLLRRDAACAAVLQRLKAIKVRVGSTSHFLSRRDLRQLRRITEDDDSMDLCRGVVEQYSVEMVAIEKFQLGASTPAVSQRLPLSVTSGDKFEEFMTHEELYGGSHRVCAAISMTVNVREGLGEDCVTIDAFQRLGGGRRGQATVLPPSRYRVGHEGVVCMLCCVWLWPLRGVWPAQPRYCALELWS